jgi:hypothetical protein
MLMGVGALYKAGLVEWMSSMTYQAASGGGAQHMRELLTQFGTLNAEVRSLLDDPKSAILEIDRKVLAQTAIIQRGRNRQLRRPAGRLADPLDRQGPRQWREPRRVESRRRDQQDPGPRRPVRHRRNAGGRLLRAHVVPCAATARP